MLAPDAARSSVRFGGYVVTFAFRVRFRLGPGVRVSAPESVLDLPVDQASGESVQIQALPTGSPIKDTTNLVLRGRPYGTLEQAIHAGNRWMQVLQIALA